MGSIIDTKGRAARDINIVDLNNIWEEILQYQKSESKQNVIIDDDRNQYGHIQIS